MPERKLSLRVSYALRVLSVSMCASVIISSALFILFLHLSVGTNQVVQIGDYPEILIIPFLTGVAIGGAMGGVRQGLFALVLTIFLSLAISVYLACLPVTLGIIENATVVNAFLISALRANILSLFIMVFIIFPGVVIGGLLVHPTQPYSSEDLIY